MTKADLAEKVAQKTGETKKKSTLFIDKILETITEALASGEKVQLIPFGSFEVRKREAREGRNPRTGVKLTISARNVPHFNAGKGIRDAVNKK